MPKSNEQKDVHVGHGGVLPIPVRTILSDLGLTGYHENLAVNLSQKYDLAFDVAEHLVRNYGTRASWLGSFRIQLPENDTAMCA